MNVDTDNPEFIEFLKHGILRNPNERSLPKSLGGIKIFNKKLNCSLHIPANFSSNLVVDLPKDLKQWRLKNWLPEERKYVIYNHNLNALIKAPLGVRSVFPDDPHLTFSSHINSQEPLASSHNAFACCETKLKSCITKTVWTRRQTEPQSFNSQSGAQLTTCLWETELEQQNKALLQKNWII